MSDFRGRTDHDKPPFGEKQVRLSRTNFLPSLIRIDKGESIELVAETSTSHTVANGTWVNGEPRLSKEAGAPLVNNVWVERECPQIIGPFNSNGSFKFCSTTQAGMNLTVEVQ
jgi:plastocyanin